MPQATLTRRAVVGGAAAGLAAAVAAPQHVFAHDHEKGRDPVPPEPIPGGIELGPGQRIHVWAPGPPTVTLPFTGATLQGVNVESTTIRDFSGFSAVAFHVGTATAKDGTRYDLETDVRAFEGTYLDRAGRRHFGTFGFI
jgi:hypothetical protein